MVSAKNKTSWQFSPYSLSEWMSWWPSWLRESGGGGMGLWTAGPTVGETQRRKERKRRCRYFARPEYLCPKLWFSFPHSRNQLFQKDIRFCNELKKIAIRFCFEKFLVGKFASIHPRTTNVAQWCRHPPRSIAHRWERREKGESEPIISSRWDSSIADLQFIDHPSLGPFD